MFLPNFETSNFNKNVDLFDFDENMIVFSLWQNKVQILYFCVNFKVN